MTAGNEFLEPTGQVVPLQGLKISRAIALANMLARGKMSFARLIECRASHDDSLIETVVFEVEVERPQILANDIRREELLAVTFDERDNQYPEVVSLRSDFPQVPHLNQRDQKFPRSLCLYDEPWQDLKLTWTAPAFVERVRLWLSLTARGSLHAEDQPLEPLIFGTGFHIIIPNAIFDQQGTLPEHLYVELAGGKEGRVFIAREKDNTSEHQGGFAHASLVLECEPQQHGVIRRTPINLKKLSDLTSEAGLDLLAALRERLWDWAGSNFLEMRLILILRFPMTRQGGLNVETTEIKCFLTSENIREIGERIGLWATHEGQVARLLPLDDSKDGSDVTLLTLNTHRAFNWELAATLSGLPERNQRKILAVGAGALGSQVILNLARSGYGIWKIADEDFLLPHNLARHALNGFALGLPKAVALSHTVNLLADDNNIASPVWADIITPGDRELEIGEALMNADVVLDMAASIAVSRYLANHPAEGRRVSLFMNPVGSDLVLLSEDRERRIGLDCLEMQYYRLLCRNNRLKGHLAQPDGPIRYGQSCRDLSSRIPQDLFAIHAGVGARALRLALSDDDARIRIWKADLEDMSIEVISVSVSTPRQQQFVDWTLMIDDWLLFELSRLRRGKLPNETGGVLVGVYDMERKIVYVVDALPSTSDSVEWPTLFIRGCDQLSAKVNAIREITNQNVEYVGEWHSHPDGCPTYPSADDLTVFAWIAEEMDIEGKPPLMIIAGEGNSCRAYLGKICKENSEVLCPS